jgi:hypothetical protein
MYDMYAVRSTCLNKAKLSTITYKDELQCIQFEKLLKGRSCPDRQHIYTGACADA